jgi:hypothetical protein
VEVLAGIRRMELRARIYMEGNQSKRSQCREGVGAFTRIARHGQKGVDGMALEGTRGRDCLPSVHDQSDHGLVPHTLTYLGLVDG